MLNIFWAVFFAEAHLFYVGMNAEMMR